MNLQVERPNVPRQPDPLLKFIERSGLYEYLGPIHLALFSVLYMHWVSNGCINPFNVQRKRLMELARIKSTATYHNKITELARWGFIRYIPSYHPVQGTTIHLLT
jgi:hypothetical protein